MEETSMVITMLVSAAVLMLIAVGMIAIMSRRQKALPREFDPPVVRASSRGTGRTSGGDD
jgi:hypothetical protein